MAVNPATTVGKTILLVDDEPTLLDALSYNLGKEGYRVVTASDGVRAVEQAESCAPDLMILDLMLPRLDGFEVCRAVRRTSMVPIIMLTAKDSETDTVLGLELGADDYLVKPFAFANSWRGFAPSCAAASPLPSACRWPNSRSTASAAKSSAAPKLSTLPPRNSASSST